MRRRARAARAGVVARRAPPGDAWANTGRAPARPFQSFMSKGARRMNKQIVAGIVVGLMSMSSHAQLGQLFQSVKEQVTQAATSQVNQGVRSATDEAVQATSTRTRKAIDSVRSPSSSAATSTSPSASAGTGDAALSEARK
ncbi:hypothetical protein V4E86_23175 [Burkholderia pseudomallei]|uniref:hypothetical protein n=1 Tax=Burkholderia pseudomallei TaxID=28450 RepID=UPI00015F7D9A|nr:hypothetical protein [Burkholderia pseudomallei]ALB96154.1 hypothetical protein AM256_20985 [Burkholderia pseudomallei]ALC02212.1 hypothetical protein AM257_21010 [Burkholderia pseudomallei]APD38287.1 hypothetical protein BK015_24315 [Burkholderia pseudomallei]ARK42825.1 hypothetical protein BOC60_21435 [Burkholderia pseudomallei]ARK46437.1 hypothetical protein BOC35_08970 [Burkholderia pseudomallei]